MPGPFIPTPLDTYLDKKPGTITGQSPPPTKKHYGPDLMPHATRGEGINKIHAEQNWSLIQRLRVCQRELRLPEEPIYSNICHEKRGRAVSITKGKGGKGKQEGRSHQEILQQLCYQTNYTGNLPSAMETCRTQSTRTPRKRPISVVKGDWFSTLTHSHIIWPQ